MRLLTVYRERRGWSKAELARRAELNASTVGQIEAGRLVPYPGQVRKLAEALELTESERERLTEEVSEDERIAA